MQYACLASLAAATAAVAGDGFVTERLKSPQYAGCWEPLRAWVKGAVEARLGDKAVYWAWFRTCLHGGGSRPLAMGDATGAKVWHCGEKGGDAYGPAGARLSFLPTPLALLCCWQPLSHLIRGDVHAQKSS